MKTYVFDANALLDFAEAGPGAQRIKNLLHAAFRGEASILVSVLNWGEVFYHYWQQHGEEKARQRLATLSRLSLTLVPVDMAQALRAGEIKALHKIPYVDCIAAALAEIHHATLVTSDRDFEKLGRRVQILWIARP